MSARHLDAYLRHARRSTELVFELAAGCCWPFKPDLTIGELGGLSLRLQKLDPDWRLPRGENDRPEADRDPGIGVPLVDPPCDWCRRAAMGRRERRTAPTPRSVCPDCRRECERALGFTMRVFWAASPPIKAPGGFEVRGVDRVVFALELIAAGWKRDHACAAAMISRSTLQRELRKSARPPKWAPEPAFQSHADVSSEGSEGDWTSRAEMTRRGAESEVPS